MNANTRPVINIPVGGYLSTVDFFRWFRGEAIIEDYTDVLDVSLEFIDDYLDDLHISVLEVFDRLLEFPDLNTLTLSDFEMYDMSSVLFELQNLIHLRINAIPITTIPDRIAELNKLETLQFINTNLTQISDAIGNLENLRELVIHDSNIRQLPDTIGNLDNLQKLIIVHNQITNLPNTIGDLNNLQELLIAETNISILPDTIGNLTNLITLDVSFNNLTQLPNTIGNLQALKHLYINSNEITILPDSITQLNLESFQINNNPIERQTNAIENFLEYYSQIGNNNYGYNNGYNQEYVENRRDPFDGINLYNNGYVGNQREPGEGIAFQIHNFFDKIDISKLLEFIKNTSNVNINSAIESIHNEEDFVKYIENTFKSIITNMNNNNDRKRNALTNFQRTFNSHLKDIEYTSNYIKIITSCLEYVKKQPKEFRDTYVSTYSHDCAYAYNGPSGMSCAKGTIERIVTSLIPASVAMIHTPTYEERRYAELISIIQNKPVNTNAPNIKRLVDEYAQECFNESNNSEERFKECIKGKIRERLGASYRNSMNQEINEYIPELALFGGKRNRKHSTHKTRKARKDKKHRKTMRSLQKLKKSFKHNKHNKKSKTHKVRK